MTGERREFQRGREFFQGDLIDVRLRRVDARVTE